MKHCSKGHCNPDDAIFCSECGEILKEPETKVKFCPSCKTENPNDAEFCHNCGCRLNTKTEKKKESPNPAPEPAPKPSPKPDPKPAPSTTYTKEKKRCIIGSVVSMCILLCVSFLYCDTPSNLFLRGWGAFLTLAGAMFIGWGVFSMKRLPYILSGLVLCIILVINIATDKYWIWFILVFIGYLPAYWGLFSHPYGVLNAWQIELK